MGVTEAAFDVAVDEDVVEEPKALGIEGAPYKYSIQQYSLTISDPRWAAGGLHAAVCVDDGAHRVTIHDGEMSLTSLKDKENLARYLEKAAPGPATRWFEAVGEAFAKVVQAERAAAMPVTLSELKPPTGDLVVQVDGIQLLRHHPTVLFGDGESYKSMLALWIAGRLAISGLNVLYADWELDAAEHRGRLGALFGEKLPAFRYLRCSAPIVSMVSWLRESCVKDRIDLLIVDSVGFAVGVPAETSEAATTYYTALRQIGVGGSLSIAHSTKKTTKADRGHEKPFGSVFWHNGARLTWLARRAPAGNGIELACRKANLFERPTSRLVQFTFGDDSIGVQVAPITDDRRQAPDPQGPNATTKPSIARRIDALLAREGPLPVEEIKANIPNARDDAVRMAIKRNCYFVDGERVWSRRLQPLEEWRKANPDKTGS